jgi:peptide/nickel transport system ATP-binding protein
MMPLLAVDKLTLKAGPTTLLHDLSFVIQPGERLGLIGESGSGKSLTALASTGLLPRAIVPHGSVRLIGHEVIGAPDRALDRLRGTAVAMVFQEPLTALDPLQRVGRQVAEPLKRRAGRDGRQLHGRALEQEVSALFEQVALPEPGRMARSYPHELSGGQRQRVAIAMALACRPQLLIADEPTTALDVTTQAEILKLLDRLVAERDMALLFISHDLAVVAGVVSRVIVLRQGVAVEAGPVREVFSTPRDAYTGSLVAAARAFDAALGGQP